MNKNEMRGLLAAALLGLTIAVSGCAGTPTTKSTGDVIDDATIATKVKAKLIEDPVVSAMNIQVETFKGTVQLSGFAATEAEKDRAAQLARDTAGVKVVKNDIRLK
jgi:osmotically-inducible protein OsmY